MLFPEKTRGDWDRMHRRMLFTTKNMFRLQTFHIMRDRSHGIVMFGILVHAISGIESIEYKIWRELSKKNYVRIFKATSARSLGGGTGG